MKDTYRWTWKCIGTRARMWLAGIFAFIMCLLVGVTAYAAEIPAHTDDFYVNDYAGIFTDEQIERIVKAGEELYDATSAQVVVLTIDTTEGEEISNYALEVGRAWEIGTKKQNNGVLIVLAVEDRSVWVAVGYGLEGQLPDSKTGRLLDENAIPYYENDEFGDGTEQLYFAIVNEVRQEYGMETVEVPEAGSDGDAVLILVGAIIVLIFIIVIIVVVKQIGGKGGGSGYSGGSYHDSGSYSGGSSFGSSGGGGSFGGGGAGRSF